MRLFPQVPIPLMHSDAYTLLIAVLLSAQCTDERVNQVTPHLFRLARDPLGMAQRSVDEIHAIIRPCGLGGQKAKAIHRLSELLLERHGGLVPNDLGALEALPGVGHKTASVVMCQAFGQPAFPVDTHIHRLATVATVQGTVGETNRTGLEGPIPQATMVSFTFAVHLLRASLLSGPRS